MKNSFRHKRFDEFGQILAEGAEANLWVGQQQITEPLPTLVLESDCLIGQASLKDNLSFVLSQKFRF